MTATGHAPRRYARLADLQALVGQEVGTSGWLDVDQARIDAFAHATGDHQWIHVDPARAASGPFGATVAHGFLTLSLIPLFGDQALAIEDVRMGVNYGLNRVRFTAPVRVGSRLRARFTLLAYQALPVDEPGRTAAQLTMEATIEIEGSAKPACVAETVSRRYT
jgi:acyl dehydratase